MSFITFGGGRQLIITISGPTGLQAGAGVQRLTFPAALDARNMIGGGVAVSLSGQAWLGPSRHDWLDTWSVDEPVVTFDGLPFDANLVLGLSDEQLAVIEQRRAGGDLQLWLDGQVVLVYDPAAAAGTAQERWPARPFQDSIPILRETWVRLLNQAAAGMSLAVVVPVPLDASTAGRVGKYLREAIAKVNDGKCEDAVTAARKAIDAMGITWTPETAVAKVRKEDRSLEQRLAMLRHALHSLASPSAHSDDIAESIRWDREKALAVIAGVSALAACRPAQ
jgi:hypothetical protein